MSLTLNAVDQAGFHGTVGFAAKDISIFSLVAATTLDWYGLAITESYRDTDGTTQTRTLYSVAPGSTKHDACSVEMNNLSLLSVQGYSSTISFLRYYVPNSTQYTESVQLVIPVEAYLAPQINQFSILRAIPAETRPTTART